MYKHSARVSVCVWVFVYLKKLIIYLFIRTLICINSITTMCHQYGFGILIMLLLLLLLLLLSSVVILPKP